MMMQPIQPNPGGFQYHIMGVDAREYDPVEVDGLQQWLAQGQMTAQPQVPRSHEPRCPCPSCSRCWEQLAGRQSWERSCRRHSWIRPRQPPQKKLVLGSHILGYGGLVVLSGGSIIGGVAAGIYGIIGLAMAVIGAIIGQVGRGMQGRAI